jgi:hypothetical protein
MPEPFKYAGERKSHQKRAIKYSFHTNHSNNKIQISISEVIALSEY